MTYYTPDSILRFWSYLDIPTDPDACWIWTGTHYPSGYGILRYNRKNIRAHRMMWEIANQATIPEGMCVCHTCDVKDCCNPRHLWIGTTQENTQDKVNKGRQARTKGESSGKSAKLNAQQVANIRQRYAVGGITQRKLANEYGVSQGQIYRIVRYIEWI